jgi:hypothetical protein
MRFPETTREGTEGHREALSRLDAAREDRRRRGEVHRDAHGTDRVREAADGLAAADEQVAAREAWVKWVERGY